MKTNKQVKQDRIKLNQRKPKKEPEAPRSEPVNVTEAKIAQTCVAMSRLLLAKNKNYGNSALTAPPLADVSIQIGILVRLGDKFKRLQQLTHGEQDKVGESLKDTIQDIAGYCILYLVSEEG